MLCGHEIVLFKRLSCAAMRQSDFEVLCRVAMQGASSGDDSPQTLGRVEQFEREVACHKVSR